MSKRKVYRGFPAIIFSLVSLLLLPGSALGAAAPTGIRCIVIDAGHGGKDPGAVGNGVREKDINLGVALKLGKKIEQGMPGVKVVYTRKDDRFLELAERSRIASEAGGDLFISIHANSAANAKAAGTETFVMGVNKGNQNLEVVMRENAVISLEPDYTSRYEGYDPNSAESVIMFSLLQYSYQTQSLELADLIQRQYVSQAKRGNRGVKQGPFLVLWRTPMPSILTEVGFVSNPDEAKYMASADGQDKLAASIYNAVAQYKKQVERVTMATGPAPGSGSAPTAATVQTAAPAVTQSNPPARLGAEPEPVSTVAAVAQEEEPSGRRRQRSTGPRTVPAGPVTTNSASAPADPPAEVPVALPGQSSLAKTEAGTSSAAAQEKIIFRIQVKSSLTRLAINASNFGSYAGKVTEMHIDGRYKYFCEESFSYKEALILQRTVRETFPDAFMVAFRNGEPVPLAQVIQ